MIQIHATSSWYKVLVQVIFFGKFFTKLFILVFLKVDCIPINMDLRPSIILTFISKPPSQYFGPCYGPVCCTAEKLRADLQLSKYVHIGFIYDHCICKYAYMQWY